VWTVPREKVFHAKTRKAKLRECSARAKLSNFYVHVYDLPDFQSKVQRLQNLKEPSMRRMTLVCLSLVCAVVLVGCAKTENTNNSNAVVTAEKPNTPSSSTATSPPSGDKIGVPECDEFIAKYESCTSKVPEAGRAAYKAGLENTRATWKQLAANPTTRSTLASACKQATETQAAAWKSYGCAQ
jgi:hypothetical protein